MKSNKLKKICVFIMLAVSLFCFQNISAENTPEMFTINQDTLESEQSSNDKNNEQDNAKPQRPEEADNSKGENGDNGSSSQNQGTQQLKPENSQQQGDASHTQGESSPQESTPLPDSGVIVKGKLSVKRTVKSDENLISEAPKIYTLEGAEYEVFSDSMCQNKVGTLTCTAQKKDSGGKLYAESNIIDLNAGKYYIKETKKSEGYMPDETVYTADISGDINIVNTLASPRFESMDMTMKFQMLNYDGQVNLPMYQKYLDCMELEIWYIPEYCEKIEDTYNKKPLKKWKLGADDKGEVKYEDKYWVENIDEHVKSDQLFKNDKGEIVGLLGTYVLRQDQAESNFYYNSDASLKVLKEGKPFGDFDPKNTTALNVEPYTLEIVINKEYSADDIYEPFGARIKDYYDNVYYEGLIASLYCVEGEDAWGNKVKAYIDVHNFPDDLYNASESVNLPVGTYTVRELKTARYKSSLQSVSNNAVMIENNKILCTLVTNRANINYSGHLVKWNNYSSCSFIRSGQILL